VRAHLHDGLQGGKAAAAACLAPSMNGCPAGAASRGKAEGRFSIAGPLPAGLYDVTSVTFSPCSRYAGLLGWPAAANGDRRVLVGLSLADGVPPRRIECLDAGACSGRSTCMGADVFWPADVRSAGKMRARGWMAQCGPHTACHAIISTTVAHAQHGAHQCSRALLRAASCGFRHALSEAAPRRQLGGHRGRQAACGAAQPAPGRAARPRPGG
jgi:hypothetical protein